MNLCLCDANELNICKKITRDVLPKRIPWIRATHITLMVDIMTLPDFPNPAEKRNQERAKIDKYFIRFINLLVGILAIC